MIELEIDLNKNLRSHRNKIRVRQGDIGEKVLIKLTNSKKDIDFPEGYSVKFEGNLRNNDYVQGIANPYNNETTKFVYQFKSEDVSVPGAYRNAFFRVYDENGNRISSEEVHIEVLKNADITKENARYYLSVLEELLEQFRNEFGQFIDIKRIEWQQYLETKENEYETLRKLHEALTSEIKKLESKQENLDEAQKKSFEKLNNQFVEIQKKIDESDVYTKSETFNRQEDGVNVLDTISGTKPTLYSEQLLVDGEQATGSIFVKDLPGNENLMGTFSNSIWKIDSVTGRIIGEGVTNAKIISEVTLPAGEYTLSFTVYKKPSISSTFSFYLDDVSTPAYSFENFNNFELGLLYTRKLVLNKETRVKYTLWGNINHEPLDFEMKIEKGEYSGYTPAPEWYGIVHGQPNLLDGTSSEWKEYTFTGYTPSGTSKLFTLEQLGLKVGDTVSFVHEVDNTAVGNKDYVRGVLAFKDSNRVTVYYSNQTTNVAAGQLGYVETTGTINEGILYVQVDYLNKSGDSNTTTAKCRKHKLIKGSLAAMDKWTPSQADSGLTPVNNGMVPFTESQYAALADPLKYVRVETLQVGRGAGIRFQFPVISEIERRHPYLFDGLTLDEKLEIYLDTLKSIVVSQTSRGGGLINGNQSNRSQLYMQVPNGLWWGHGNSSNTSAEFINRTVQLTGSWPKQVHENGVMILAIVSKQNSNTDLGVVSDGITPAWVEVQDIRLIVELEINGKSVVEEIVAKNHYTKDDSDATFAKSEEVVLITENQLVGGIKNFRDGIKISNDSVASVNEHITTILTPSTLSILADGQIAFIKHGSLVIVNGSIKFKTDCPYGTILTDSISSIVKPSVTNGIISGHGNGNTGKSIYIEKGTTILKTNSAFAANEWFTFDATYWAGND